MFNFYCSLALALAISAALGTQLATAAYQTTPRALLERCVDCRLENIDLRRADLHGLRIVGDDLRNADLRGANLRGVTFVRVTLSGARLDGADLRDVTYEDSRIDGTLIGQAS